MLQNVPLIVNIKILIIAALNNKKKSYFNIPIWGFEEKMATHAQQHSSS